jgi:tetratricopeptide (TPR) repeat protein
MSDANLELCKEYAEKAAEALQVAVDFPRYRGLAHRNLAMIYAQEGQKELAITHIREAAESNGLSSVSVRSTMSISVESFGRTFVRLPVESGATISVDAIFVESLLPFLPLFPVIVTLPFDGGCTEAVSGGGSGVFFIVRANALASLRASRAWGVL